MIVSIQNTIDLETINQHFPYAINDINGSYIDQRVIFLWLKQDHGDDALQTSNNFYIFDTDKEWAWFPGQFWFKDQSLAALVRLKFL